eukprot:Polyplicarium_translucidae@DN1729_c0_g1_i4.p3
MGSKVYGALGLEALLFGVAVVLACVATVSGWKCAPRLRCFVRDVMLVPRILVGAFILDKQIEAAVHKEFADVDKSLEDLHQTVQKTADEVKGYLRRVEALRLRKVAWKLQGAPC